MRSYISKNFRIVIISHLIRLIGSRKQIRRGNIPQSRGRRMFSVEGEIGEIFGAGVGDRSRIIWSSWGTRNTETVVGRHLRRRWTWQRNLVNFPGGHWYGMLIGGIATPQGLDECGRRLPPSDHVLLPLLLLDLQRKSTSQNSLQSNKEGAMIIIIFRFKRPN